MAGRGGAGNIEAANRRISQDLEASRSHAEAGTEESPIAQALQSEKAPQDTALHGRGGAGNTYSPAALSQTGTFADTVTPPSNGSGSESKPVDIVADNREGPTAAGGTMQGRGGAGNYFAGDPKVVEGREPLTGKDDKGQLKTQVEKDVEKGLAKPEAAYLAGKDRDATKENVESGSSPATG